MVRFIKILLITLIYQVGFSQIVPLTAPIKEFKDRVQEAVEEKFPEISSTGLVYLNGQITINSIDNTKFDVPAGYGVIIDNTVNPISRKFVSWSAFTSQSTPYLTASTNTFVGIKYINEAATLELTQELQSAAERSDVIVLGWLEHLAGTTIEKVGTEPDYNVNTAMQFQQYLESVGAFNIEGNDVTFNGANLKLNISAGTIFDNGLGFTQDKRRPNHYITNGINQVQVKYTYRNGTGDWFNAVANTTNLDPTKYDDGSGTLQSIPSGKWSIQRVYYYAPFGYLDIYYDQKYYNSKADALNGYLVDQISENPYLSYDIPIAIIVVKSEATDLSDISHCEIRSVNDKSIGGTGAGGGEANTASNIGTQGVGVFAQKLGVDLEFKNIKAGNNTIVVQEDANNNIGITATEQNVVKFNIKGIKDASTYGITPSVNDIYILTNYANKVGNWGTLNGGDENCLVIYNGTSWSVLRNASLETINGNLQVYNLGDNFLYYFNKTTGKWVKSNDIQKGSKIVYVDPVIGVDATTSGSISTPYKTLTYALSQIDNSGYTIALFSGNYTDTTTVIVNKLNVKITAIGSTTGNTFLNFILNVQNASSTVGLFGLNMTNLVVDGAGSCYADNCQITTSFTKTGSGYFRALNCGFDGSAANTVSGAGSCVFDGGQQGFLTISNAGALVTVKNNISMFQSSVTAGLLDLQNATVYSSTNTANAVTTSTGTTLSVNGSRFVTPSGTTARLSIGGLYAVSNTSFDYANTTFGSSSVNLDNESFFNKLRVDGGGNFQWLDFAYNASFKKPYVSGAIVYYNSSLYISNAAIPVGTAFAEGTSGATWKKITGSGGGTSVLNPQKQVAMVANAAENPNVSFSDEDLVVLQNVVNINSFWVIASGQTLVEGDIIKYRSATSDWIVDTNMSGLTTIDNGNYQVFDKNKRTVWYFDKDYSRWHEFHADEYYRVQITGSFSKGFGGNITSDNGTPVYSQATIGSTANLGSSTTFGADDPSSTFSILDGGRVVSFYHQSNTFYMQVGTISSNTITYGSSITIGSCFKGMAFASPIGGIVTVESTSTGNRGVTVRLFNWNGTNYIQSAITTFDANGTTSGMNNFFACMNANNTLEVIYEIQTGVTKRAAAFVGSTTITSFTPVQLSATSIGIAGCYTFGTSGRSMMLYRVNNVLTAKGFSRNTDGTFTDETTNLINFTEGNNNQDRLTYCSRTGNLLMFYYFNNTLYSRWFNGTTATMTAGAETLSYYGDTYANPVMGENYNQGVALVRFSDSNLPKTVGWVKNGDGVAFAVPPTTAGSRVNINTSAGNSILYNVNSYIWTLSGQLNSGIAPPYRPESGIIGYTTSPNVVPDFIFQDTGNNGDYSNIAMTGDISRAHSNLVAGTRYYFNSGTVTSMQTNIQAGMALNAKELSVDIEDDTVLNSHTTTIDNHTSTLASQSSKISALESGLDEEYNLPSYSHGFGLWFVKNGSDYMSGNDSQTRNFGHTNLDKPAPIPNLTNGVKIVSYEQHQNNGLIAAKIGRDASGKGYLFLYGWDNSGGQWADGTTTSDSNRKGRFIMLDNSQFYGTTKSVEKVFISKTTWSNDGVRPTIVISVYDSSDSVNPYKCYAWGYASDNAGDTWRMYPHTSNISTSPVLVKNGNLVACAIGVLGAYYSFDEGSGVTGRLYYCGYYTANYMNGTGLTSNVNTLTQCKYANNSNITTCKDIVTYYDVAGVEMRTMLNFEGEQYSCGYNINGQLGIGNTTNVNLFTKVNIPVISGSKIIKIEIGMKNGFSLTSDGRLYGWGQNYDYILNDNTATLSKGVVTITTTGTNNPVLNTTYSSPLLIASNVETFWLRKFGHIVNSVLIWKESTTKKLYMNGAANNIFAVDDLSTRTTTANYRRQLALPDSYEQSNYEPLDVQFIGKVTATTEYFVGLMVLIKNKTTNKKYLVRCGYMHNLVGFSGDFTTNRSDYGFIFMKD